MLNTVLFRSRHVGWKIWLTVGLCGLVTLAVLVDNHLPVKWGGDLPTPIAISHKYVVEMYFGPELMGIRDLHNCMGVHGEGKIICCPVEKNCAFWLEVDQRGVFCNDRDYENEMYWHVFDQMPDISFMNQCNPDQQECGQFVTGYGPDEELDGPFCWTWPMFEPYFNPPASQSEGGS